MLETLLRWHCIKSWWSFLIDYFLELPMWGSTMVESTLAVQLLAFPTPWWCMSSQVLSYCVTVWLCDCLTVLLSYCLTVLLSDCLTVWLSVCLTVSLSDCLTVWQGPVQTQLDNCLQENRRKPSMSTAQWGPEQPASLVFSWLSREFSTTHNRFNGK